MTQKQTPQYDDSRYDDVFDQYNINGHASIPKKDEESDEIVIEGPNKYSKRFVNNLVNAIKKDI